MRHFLSTFHRALAALLIVTGVASATPITLATPGGLNPGDKFRFLQQLPTALYRARQTTGRFRLCRTKTLWTKWTCA